MPDPVVHPAGLRPQLQTVAKLALVFAGYAAAGALGLAAPFTSTNVSPVWPAAGVALTALLLWGWWMWPAVAAAAFLVNFTTGLPGPTAAVMAVGNASGALLGAYLLKRIVRFPPGAWRLKHVLGLIILGAGLSTTVPATIGVTALFLGGLQPWSSYSSAWLVWWLGDATGIVIVAPLLLSWGSRRLRPRPWLRLERLEWVLLMGASAVTSLAVFQRHLGEALRDDALAFVVFPLVIWGAIRFGVWGAATASVVIATIAVWGTASGFGPFVQHGPLHDAVLLQSLLAVVSTTGMILAAVIAERTQAEDALQREQQAHFERRRAEEAQRASQERLQGIIGSVMDAIITVDQQQQVVVFNQAAEQIFGIPAQEALGQSLGRFIPPRFREAHREHVRMFGSTGVTSRSMSSPGVLAGLRADGTEFPIEATISQVESNGQKLFTVVLRDVTERRQAEEALRNSEKLAAAGRMAAAVAHEINNPLESVTNLLYLLRSTQLDESAREYVQTAERELERVAHITKQTLQFYRNSGPPAAVDLCALLDEVMELFAPALTAHDVRVHRQYRCRSRVVAHAGELRQVFANVISNAIEAGASEVRVRVTRARTWTGEPRSGVRVTVLDNGPGLSPEYRRHAFRPFVTTKEGKGTGLGLWVTRGIVEKYEGSIRLRSRNTPGRSGTCVTIFLPVRLVETPGENLREANHVSRLSP